MSELRRFPSPRGGRGPGRANSGLSGRKEPTFGALSKLKSGAGRKVVFDLASQGLEVGQRRDGWMDGLTFSVR